MVIIRGWGKAIRKALRVMRDLNAWQRLLQVEEAGKKQRDLIIAQMFSLWMGGSGYLGFLKV